MAYTLITGGTGLLGGYLLRDCLRRNLPVAVLARPTAARSALARIEAQLQPWETTRNLPRPMVLSGDLTEEGLQLSSAARSWCARHVRRVLHAAASIAFYREESGEPYRSNVTGLTHLLEFCRTSGVREFHHISTAYVCGQRSGIVREAELEVGQTWGNDYEQSKVAGENMVRGASFLHAATIYRPSIIVGDHETGHTTTFHGFYTPLQVAWWLTLGGVLTSGQDDWFLEQLGLSGQERKNLVPVDWVSQAVLALMQHPGATGGTYHLTHASPPTVREISAAIGTVIRRHGARQPQRPKQMPDTLRAEDFRTHMQTYRAYFRDDPEFDQSQLHQHLPQFACPRVSVESLVRTGMFALERNFVPPRLPARAVPFDLARFAATLPCRPAEPAELLLELTGPGGGALALAATPDGLCSCGEGRPPGEPATFRLRTDQFRTLLQNEISLEGALRGARAYLAVPAARREAVLYLLRLTIAAAARSGACHESPLGEHIRGPLPV